MRAAETRLLPDLYTRLADLAPDGPRDAPHRGTYVTKADVETVDEGRTGLLLGSVAL